MRKSPDADNSNAARGRIRRIDRRPWRRATSRRANTIVLVIGILVLLVIIAAAFVSRTQAGRSNALASRQSVSRDDIADTVAGMIADEIAGHLFVRPVDPNDPLLPFGRPAMSNFPRLSSDRQQVRYGVDPDSRFPYNFAPYQVVPFTNWPDKDVGDPFTAFWPAGPGNPGGGGGVPFDLLESEGNPIGNPGFGDGRLWADVEPLRWVTGNGGALDTNLSAFSHWRHLSNLSRPDNGWRIVFGIDDVGDSDGDGFGRIINNLSIPVEQWLPVMPGNRNPATGSAVFTNIADFNGRWDAWFTPASVIATSYPDVYWNPSLIPANLYVLWDLDSNGVRHDAVAGDRPADEFIPGTARHTVGRVLADTDGDGMTDSFWFVVPALNDSGVRHVVAVRIVDNCAMVNANTATRFNRFTTFGANPADVALVGQNFTGPLPSPNKAWNTGLLDNHANWEEYYPRAFSAFSQPDAPNSPFGTSVLRYESDRWYKDADERDFLSEIGAEANLPFTFVLGEELISAGDRIVYYGRSGSRPFDALGGLTPFTLADELELRLYWGQNYPWIISRFERSVNSNLPQNAILHSTNNRYPQGPGLPVAQQIRAESSEHLDQLSNREMFLDLRHKLTLFSGARNDLLPPWLRVNRNAAEQRLDLRDPGAPDHDEIRDHLVRALLYEGAGPSRRQSYFGTDGVAAANAEALAAAFTANLLDYRDMADPDVPGDVDEPTIVTSVGVNPRRYMGMEPQPFLVEAFIGHIYKAFKVPATDLNGTPYTNAGVKVVLDDPDVRSTVIAVQLANPTRHTIDLSQYVLNVFGQPLDLSTLPADQQVLRPATPDRPVSAVFYAIRNSVESNDGTTDPLPMKWTDFLDIIPNDGNLPEGSIWARVTGDWDVDDRDTYDNSTEAAVELRRRVGGLLYAVDRFDPPGDREFGEAINDLESNKPGTAPNPINSYDLGGFPGPYDVPGMIQIGGAGSPYTHWVQWVRATRAWGVDLDDNGTYDADERNPRYASADRAVVVPTAATTPDGSYVSGGNKYKYGEPPDDNPLTHEPWFKREYINAKNQQVSRKPTFFDMRMTGNFGPAALAAGFYPDKGWYAQMVDSDGDGVLDELGGVDDPTREVGPGGVVVSTSRLDHPMQMLLKQGDFDQVGELLNVWMFGHTVEQASTGLLPRTLATFSEHLSLAFEGLLGADIRANRLRVRPTDFDDDGIPDAGAIIGGGLPYDPTMPSTLEDPRHAVPALPAALRVLDLFVCDSYGRNPFDPTVFDLNGNGVIDPEERDLRRYNNANGFRRQMTPGLVNINTAPREVLRTLPQWYKMPHAMLPVEQSPRVGLPESVVQYRERLGANNGPAIAPLAAPIGNPDYADRDLPDSPPLHAERGMVSPAEVLLLTRDGNLPGPQGVRVEPTGEQLFNAEFRADLAAMGVFYDPGPDGLFGTTDDIRVSADVSTDVTHAAAYPAGSMDPEIAPDTVAGDAEEANLLFAGVSNLLTTRSDTFTVYFKIRSFKQNPVTGRWDATDPEYILDDSRYVMLVDRSEVNRPDDHARILYLEKLPR